MENEKQKQEQKIKDKQKEIEKEQRQLRRKKIIEGGSVVSMEDMALLDSPLLPKETSNT